MAAQNSKQKVGVIGAGSFGTAITQLLSINTEVLIFARNQKVVDEINQQKMRHGVQLPSNVSATNKLEELCQTCELIFPVIPSENLRALMKDLAPFLHPYHLIIHAIKGFDATGLTPDDFKHSRISRTQIHTMSDVIRQESNVIRVGCLSGPNLAKEILEGQPTATLIASRFTEVIEAGKTVLSSPKFHVFGSNDLLGAELAGALKNVIAIGSGLLKGYGLGKNIQAMLITRGLMEMILFGKTLGADVKAFLGTAGIGDLIATATSQKSRNYTFGFRLGSGETLDNITKSTDEVVEGLRTLQITRTLARNHKLHAPITEMLYRIVFNGFPIEEAMNYLMTFPYDVDVDFI